MGMGMLLVLVPFPDGISKFGWADWVLALLLLLLVGGNGDRWGRRQQFIMRGRTRAPKAGRGKCRRQSGARPASEKTPENI
jgi:hypothetical protein